MFPKKSTYEFQDWSITTSTGHILASKGEIREQYEKDINLPHLPDMLFFNNFLKINHKEGFGIEFKAYDSLMLVDPKADLIKVHVAKDWKESRSECEYIDKLVAPFDWTFTTNYKGTLTSDNQKLKLFEIETNERIDLEKLRKNEPILFFDEICLFEDELSDHGVSSLNIKIRVMPTSFYLLQRFFLRVDGVVIRVYDTRIYHEVHNRYLIREYTEKESLVKNLNCPSKYFIESNEIVNYLDLKNSTIQKLEFPNVNS